MATDPFSLAFVDRLEDTTQAYRLQCLIGHVVAFRFYCCDDPPVLGVDKAPVALLSLDPEIQCLNTNVAWDVSNSYSPTGTIDTYTITWGDATTTGPNAWAGAKTGNKQYTTAGTYTVKLTVTDLLGTSGTTEVQVEIVDCSTPDPVLMGTIYALSKSAGPHVLDCTEAAPAWEQRVRGLTGGWLIGHDLKLDPHRKHLKFGSRHVWIATAACVAKSTTDMRLWRRLRLPDPRNTAGDVPVPTVSSLTFICLAFNPMVRDEIYVLAGSVALQRTWIYWTTDGGVTWDSWEVRY